MFAWHLPSTFKVVDHQNPLIFIFAIKMSKCWKCHFLKVEYFHNLTSILGNEMMIEMSPMSSKWFWHVLDIWASTFQNLKISHVNVKKCRQEAKNGSSQPMMATFLHQPSTKWAQLLPMFDSIHMLSTEGPSLRAISSPS